MKKLLLRLLDYIVYNAVRSFKICKVLAQASQKGNAIKSRRELRSRVREIKLDVDSDIILIV